MEKVLSVLFVLLFIFPLRAEAKDIELTVEQAVEYAIKNSKTLKSGQIDLEIKKRQKDTAWNVFIPSLSVSGTINRATEVADSTAGIGAMLNPIYQNLNALNATSPNPILQKIQYPQITSKEAAEIDHWKLIGSISAQFNFSVAMIQGIQVTKANYEAGLITWEQSVKQTERDVKKMFYALLLQQESLNLQKVMLDNAENRWKQAEINYKNGLVPELSVLQARVSFENRKPSIIEMDQSLEQQLETFAFLLGLSYGTKIHLIGDINPSFQDLDALSLVDKYINNRLDIKSMIKNIDILKISLAANLVQTYTPSLSFNYSYQPVILKITDSWLDDKNSMDNGSFSFSFAFNLTNMLPFSSNMQNIKTTKSNIQKAEIGLETITQSAEMEIHTLVDKLNKSRSSIEANNLNISLAQQAYNMTYDAYINGNKELLDVKDAESQLSQAQLGLVQEKYTYIATMLDLEYAINTSLEGK